MLDILLVEDEPQIRITVGDALRAEGHRVVFAFDGAEGLSLVTSRVFDLVITDIRLPRVDGLTIFRRVRELGNTDVILMTGFGAVSEAVGALKEGACDYLTKPFDLDELVIRVKNLAQRRALQSELARVRAERGLAEKEKGTVIIGRSPQMIRLRDRIATIAESDSPVLITGESGTGKELVARRLHELSPRRNKPFVAVNCAAFPESLIEAELFGHERGAFTGAVKKRDGRFKLADGGTLFLDEIAEIPPPTQVKLLRVLQEGTIEPLGTNTTLHIDARVLSATHRNLKTLMAEGKFREDLYYRLNVLDISIPPLRERRGEVPVLIEHFLNTLRPGLPVPTFTAQAWAALAEYPFPGNVRELEHAVEHAVVLTRGKEIGLEHLPADIARMGGARTLLGESSNFLPLSVAVREFEREYLLRALNLTEGRKARAADMLGISRKNLWEKLRGYGIMDSDLDESA